MSKFANVIAIITSVISLAVVILIVTLNTSKEKIAETTAPIILHTSPNSFIEMAVPDNTIVETDNETFYKYGTKMQYSVASDGALQIFANDTPVLETGGKSNISEIGERFTFYTNWDTKRYLTGMPAKYDIDLKKLGLPTTMRELQGMDTVYFADGFLRKETVYRTFADTVNDLSAVMECCYGQQFVDYYNENNIFYTRLNNYSVGAQYVNSNTTLTIKAKGELAQAMLLAVLYEEN